jgi:hypothetical protein
MDETNKPEVKQNSVVVSCRLSAKEADRLSRQSAATGKSFSALLREMCFGKTETAPIMHREDQRAIANDVRLLRKELLRLDERLIEPGMESVKPVLRDLLEKVDHLFLFMGGINGNS